MTPSSLRRLLSSSSGFRRFAHHAKKSDERASASSKLFADAAREDADEAAASSSRRSRNPLTQIQNDNNWTGEESVHDAVLRMLVDKYKPLRSGHIKTADEKLRQAPPKLSAPATTYTSTAVATGTETDTLVTNSVVDEPILPGVEGHRPWHTTFKVPSHATASVKFGNFPQSKPSPRSPPVLDERAQKKEREGKKRVQEVTRLTRARESTLDYRLGIKGGRGDNAAAIRPNPVSIKGWVGIVEERIERARSQGHFNKISGRGKPIARHQDEHNPFVAREEFLMNRIVKRQGAAPPWVEIQGELETAVNAFREVLRQSWTRRAIRMLTMSRPAALLPRLTMADVTSLRDAEWEERERAYHTTALDELNALVRKYNGVAPYAVRRPYYALAAELEKVYRDGGEDILKGIADRVRDQSPRAIHGVWEEDGGERVGVGGAAGDSWGVMRVRDVVREWLSWGRGK